MFKNSVNKCRLCADLITVKLSIQIWQQYWILTHNCKYGMKRNILKKTIITLCLYGLATTAIAESAKNPSKNSQESADPKVVKRIDPNNLCDEYMSFSIGYSFEKLLDKWGEPDKVVDISAESFTWRVDDNFLTLMYDKDRLVSIEIDHKCSEEPNNACAVYDKYRQSWPKYEVVELEYGEPVEKEDIPREEWVYMNETEKVYFELQRGAVANIECIPTEFIIKKEAPKPAPVEEEPKEPVVEEKAFDPYEYYEENYDDPSNYDDSLEYE